MEAVVGKKLYEVMFLVDSAQASNWDATIATLEKVLERADAEDVSMRKWDERRLAYEINGKSRGTYILCYFKADGEKIREIEKAVQLSEQVMRVLILSAEQMTAEDIKKDTPAGKAEKEEAAAKEAAAEEAAAKEAAQAAESEQEGSEQEPAAAGEVEMKEEAGQSEQAGKTAETAETEEEAEKAEVAGEAEESKEPSEREAGDGTEAFAETESEQTEEEHL
jgi:small subunit ribosomal protein S6